MGKPSAHALVSIGWHRCGYAECVYQLESVSLYRIAYQIEYHHGAVVQPEYWVA